MFVLDTDVLSELQRKKPHPNVVRWLSQQPASEIATTVINISEIKSGLERVRPQNPGFASQLSVWLDRITSLGEAHILDYDLRAGLLFGEMREVQDLRHFASPDRRRKYAAVGSDLMIASIAICRGACVATHNVRDYLKIHAHFALPGLFDPVSMIWHVRAPEDKPWFAA